MRTTMILLSLVLLLGCNEESSQKAEATNELSSQNNVELIETEESSTEMITEEPVSSNSEQVNYSDIFIEPALERTSTEEISEREELTQLDKDSKELLVKMDELIKEDDLKLIDSEDIDAPLDTFLETDMSEKMKKLEKKLNKLGN